METLEKTLQVTHDWAVDRLHILCDMKTDDVLKSVEDAHAIRPSDAAKPVAVQPVSLKSALDAKMNKPLAGIGSVFKYLRRTFKDG